MSWTAPRTWVNGEVPAASTMNTHIRDNINALVWQEAVVGTSETTTNTAFTNLTTTGPSLTLTTQTTCFIYVGCNHSNNTLDDGGAMSYAVSGGTTIAAIDQTSWFFISQGTAGAQAEGGRLSRIGSLNAGSNTFTAKYRVQTGGTGTFLRRHILGLAVS